MAGNSLSNLKPRQQKKKEENKAQLCCFLAPPELQSCGSRKHADVCEPRLIDGAASLFSSQLDPQLSAEEPGSHRDSCAGERQRRPYLSVSPSPSLWPRPSTADASLQPTAAKLREAMFLSWILSWFLRFD